MEDLTFKPAGAAFVAVLAALAPAAAQAGAHHATSAAEKESAARAALAAVAAKLGQAAPFGKVAQETTVNGPAAKLSTGSRTSAAQNRQLGLPFGD